MRAIEWRDGRVRFLDQTTLPQEERYVETDDPSVIAEAIRTLSIRGAPLIGIAAAYGFALSLNTVADAGALTSAIERAYYLLASTRPTAVNLFWALDRMRRVAMRDRGAPLDELKRAVLREALAIHAEDEAMCTAIGRHGASLLPRAASVLTHCNTGRLATGGSGTAQSVLTTAWEQGTLRHVYIDETRPLLQGARLTSWELTRLGVPCTLITDNTAGFVMKRGLVNAVVVGADRITLKGDVANKVGTYGLGVLAKHHRIPLIVAAPTSTIDRAIVNGEEIPIEERSAREVTGIGGVQIAPEGVGVYSPAFDITPHDLVTAIVTEGGVLRPPFRAAIEELLRALPLHSGSPR